ncbi:hypothetical protein PIIN_01367 [Serendipita indica DSM 11827]|uniref:Uncharacterized protein n=1 Tax=Serendipita indica (strain DSM 11827) TaxID=1109443 RepID=G4T877_SERID|nr:hypothetical protein PIIN_01367 [Serendipita indica DSM 11827]
MAQEDGFVRVINKREVAQWLRRSHWGVSRRCRGSNSMCPGSNPGDPMAEGWALLNSPKGDRQGQ